MYDSERHHPTVLIYTGVEEQREKGRHHGTNHFSQISHNSTAFPGGCGCWGAQRQGTLDIFKTKRLDLREKKRNLNILEFLTLVEDIFEDREPLSPSFSG